MSITWNTSPAVVAARMDAAAERFPRHVADSVHQTLQEGAHIMERAVLTRGQKDGRITGSRIATGAMFESIDAHVDIVSPAAVSGEYGYLNSPYYTIFQEFGTRRGIIGVAATVDGGEYVRRNIPARLLITPFWETL